MYNEYVFDDRIFLAHIDRIYTPGTIRTVAMVKDGKVMYGADYDHARDSEAVSAFAKCYGVEDDGNRKTA